MPPVAHIIYIPVVLLIGIVIGFVLGGRAALDAHAAQARAQEEKAARRAARQKAQPADTEAKPKSGG